MLKETKRRSEVHYDYGSLSQTSPFFHYLIFSVPVPLPPARSRRELTDTGTRQ